MMEQSSVPSEMVATISVVTFPLMMQRVGEGERIVLSSLFTPFVPESLISLP